MTIHPVLSQKYKTRYIRWRVQYYIINFTVKVKTDLFNLKILSGMRKDFIFYFDSIMDLHLHKFRKIRKILRLLRHFFAREMKWNGVDFSSISSSFGAKLCFM